MTSTAKDLAASLSELMNTAALVAAPRVYAKVTDTAALRQGLIDAIDKLVSARGAIGRTGPDADRFSSVESAALELRARVIRWDPGAGLAFEVTEQARICLGTFEIPPPPGGWDRFEGWNEP